MSKNTRLLRQLGFTLIELMVAITLMLLLVGGGIAGYSRINQRQNLVNAGRETQLQMRAAQKKARAGEKPTGCDKLQSYSVKVGAGDLSLLELYANCDSGSYLRSSYTTPVGVSYADAFEMRFFVLHGGVDGADEVRLTSSRQEFVFAVDQGGQIGEGEVRSLTTPQH